MQFFAYRNNKVEFKLINLNFKESNKVNEIQDINKYINKENVKIDPLIKEYIDNRFLELKTYIDVKLLELKK